jgi:hypothetical protein
VSETSTNGLRLALRDERERLCEAQGALLAAKKYRRLTGEEAEMLDNVVRGIRELNARICQLDLS